MRRFLPLLFLLTLCFGFWTTRPSTSVVLRIPTPPVPVTSIGNYASDVHHISMRTKSGEDLCSSTAVGKHTLLTAAHCGLGTGKVNVDGKVVAIDGVLYDEQDHMLLILKGITFPAHVAIEQRLPLANEHVRIWGWPGFSTRVVFREGPFEFQDRDDKEYIYLLPVYPGDSGSGIFSDNGKVISVISTGNRSAQAGAYPLAFTPEQLSTIR